MRTHHDRGLNAFEDARNVAPIGWHVPSDAELTTLGNSVGAFALKESGTTHWAAPNSGTNSSGFTALPSGYHYSGGFNSIAYTGSLFTSTASGSNAWCRLINNTNTVNRYAYSKAWGFSIRCIKDDTTPTVGGITYDVDGNAYNEVVIDSQIWMLQNLAVSKYRDGTVIPNVTDNTVWNGLTTGALCAYNNDLTNVFNS